MAYYLGILILILHNGFIIKNDELVLSARLTGVVNIVAAVFIAYYFLNKEEYISI